MYNSKILSTGSYLPLKKLTNKDIEKMVDTTAEWIVERTGIEERSVASESEVTSDLCVNAARVALQRANLKPEDIDMIIVATVSGDQVMPSTACMVQAKLGCRHIFAFDLSAACSGFVYSLSIADQFIKTGMYKNVLVIGAEILTRLVDYKDRNTSILFGDGAGCVIISRADENSDSKIYSTHLFADGQLGHLLELKGNHKPTQPFSDKVVEYEFQYINMKGKEIFKNAVRTLVDCAQMALDQNNMPLEKVDWFIPHQANMRITESVAKHFKIPTEKVVSTIHFTGNTSAASIPIAFDHAVTDGRIKRGQHILLSAFGAGLTSGSALLKF
ncbi:MAG: beta-ketoacyl-ACP synthase III [Bdellovibrionota bacterium]